MVVQSAHHPVKTCHLPRNIYDNITTVTKNVCRLGMIHDKF